MIPCKRGIDFHEIHRSRKRLHFDLILEVFRTTLDTIFGHFRRFKSRCKKYLNYDLFLLQNDSKLGPGGEPTNQRFGYFFASVPLGGPLEGPGSPKDPLGHQNDANISLFRSLLDPPRAKMTPKGTQNGHTTVKKDRSFALFFLVLGSCSRGQSTSEMLAHG